MTVWSRLAPIFSVRVLTVADILAISLTASSLNSSFIPSVLRRAMYCLIRALSGSVRMRTKSCSVSESSSTRIGNRPWNSGIRSEGLDEWNAPA